MKRFCRALFKVEQGYIMKQEMSEKVTMALRQIMAGKIYVSEAVNERI
jgi:DNA-binding NarL/FixJ family response regulator